MAALIALALSGAAPARAQVPDPFARDLAQKLARAETTLSEQGYMRAAGPFSGGLAQRGERRIALTMRSGQYYGIVGVCDGRCAVDVRLYDPNGAQVGRGENEAGASFMEVRPAFTGAYTVVLEVTRCTGAECWYAVNAYTR